jgi:transcriptional regulator with XRE-family HTH domain
MADILDVSKSTYIKYERGEREPRYGTLTALSEFFDVSVDYLLGKSDEDNRYIYEINETYAYLASPEYAEYHGENLKNIQKLIADYIQFINYTCSDYVLDIIYFFVSLHKKVMDVYWSSYGLFHTVGAGLNGAELEELQKRISVPTHKHYENYIRETNELRKLLDDFISLLSTEEFHLAHELKHMPYQQQEISSYANINKDELKMKFHSEPFYKSPVRYGAYPKE